MAIGKAMAKIGAESPIMARALTAEMRLFKGKHSTLGPSHLARNAAAAAAAPEPSTSASVAQASAPSIPPQGQDTGPAVVSAPEDSGSVQ
jgi:hypothetical protein